MAEVLVLAELTAAGAPTRHTLETLTAARVLGEPVAVVLGLPGAAAAADELARYGATRVLVGESAECDAVLVTPAVDLLARLVAQRSPAAVVVPASAHGREVAGRLAVRTGSGFLTDVVGLAADGTATQLAFGGTTVVHARVTTGTPVHAWRAHSLTPAPAPVPAVVEHVPVEPPTGVRQTRVVERVVERATGRPGLAEASVVVAVGRGVSGPAEYALVEELADALGAAIGASRAAVDAGFCPSSCLVGQSGTRVAPRLYLAVGISGAAQHWSGVRSAQTVVAVNSDPTAPVFALADFGVVGDLATVVPELTAQITASRG